MHSGAGVVVSRQQQQFTKLEGDRFALTEQWVG
jgi:hypothetical protein